MLGHAKPAALTQMHAFPPHSLFFLLKNTAPAMAHTTTGTTTEMMIIIKVVSSSLLSDEGAGGRVVAGGTTPPNVPCSLSVAEAAVKVAGTVCADAAVAMASGVYEEVN